MLFSYFINIFKCEGFVETPTQIGFHSIDNLSGVTIKNALVRKDGLELRQGADGGAFIRFDAPNPEDNWSFTINMTLPSLHYPEYASVYLWYVNDPQPGDFKGISENFDGMVAGVEIVGKYIELALGASDGTMDARAHEDVLLMRDAADPRRFSSAGSLKLKVISTSKNFKMEIYDGEQLLYDGLRYLTPAALGDIKKGKSFAITTTYEKVPSYKSFVLKSAELSRREENDDYDPLEIRAERPQTVPRLGSDVHHSNAHVRHLLANLEHATAFMRAAIGDPIGMSLLRGMGSFSRAVTAHDDALSATVADIEADTTPPHAIEVIEARVRNAATRIAVIENSIAQMHSAINRIEHGAYGTVKTATFGALAIGAAILAVAATRILLTRIFFHK